MIDTRLCTRFVRWLRGGGLRPVVVVALLAAFFVAFPDRNFSLGGADAASSSPACASGVGVGGPDSNTVALTVGGHGCVVIKYVSDGVVLYETFNYTGADQTWTVPSGVTSANFYLLGAGGGGSTYATFGDGGGGGYATGSYAVTAAQVLTVIVGQRGGGDTGASGTVSNCLHTPLKYGGGGQGGSCQVGGYAPGSIYYSSGGGRSAVRLSNNTEIATAGGGGGGGYGGTSVGGAGGGTTGATGGASGGGGGTQSAGGARGSSARANGTAGSAFLGGRSDDEGGGGGGGYYGGGGAGDNGGGGGGSSYVELLTDGSTTAGSAQNLVVSSPSTPSTSGLSCSNHNISLTVTTTSNGGTPLVNYEYHIATAGKPSSQPTTWTAFDPAQTTSPLTWDLRALGYSSGTFRFYVRAVNTFSASTGSWLSNSDSSCGITISATAPSAPTSLTATPGSGSASISFTAGSSNGASITNYSYSTNGSSYTLRSPADASSPITIPGLTGGTSYTIYLKAINSAGTSSASTSVTVTPLGAAPTVSGVSGNSGTSAGGTAITITGTNFLSGATVTVGGAACTSVTVVSATSITCTTPAGSAGAQDVVVTNTDTQSATLSGGFTYIAPPSATATPAVATASDSGSSNTDGVTSDNTPTISVGSATNGNTVTVTATKAGSANVTCTFTATAQSSCDLGTLADGTWSVTSTQTNSGVTSAASSALSMTIDTARPTVSSFSSTKTNGTYGLGTEINITATMSEEVAVGASITVTLDTGDTVVLTRASGTTLTGTYTVGVGDNSSDLTVSSYVLTSAPADTAGNVMTSTTVPSGANNIAGAHAIAISTTPPVVGSVSSSSGTVSGGTAITITGTGFASGATVTIGGASCTSVVVVSSTSITCTTPAGTTGAKDVVVTNSDAQASTLTGGFTYLPAAPGTPDVDAGSDSGSSNSDNITSDNTPTISVGSATNGNTVTVTATKAGSTSVTCTFTATAQSSCDLGTLADGTWSITSKQTGAGVDSAISAAVSVTVDTTGPTVASFSTTQSNGTFGVGSAVNITATMNEAVADGASITITLNTGDTVVMTKASGTTLTGTYTVGAGDNSSDLTVSSYVLTSAPVDTAGNVMTSTLVPSGANNIAGAHAIVIDTAGPTAASAAANSTGGQVTITMSEALHATTAVAGDFAVSVGGVSVVVSSVTVSGSTVVLNLATNVAVGATISVVYTAPASNSATSNSAIQDSVGNDAAGFTTTAVVPAATTTTTAPAPSGGGGGSPASATTTTTTTTTTTAVPTTTTTVAPVSATTTTTTAKRRATTTTAPLRSSSTSTSTSTSSTTSTVVRITTTTIFRPLVPLAPVSTLPRATTSTSSTSTTTSTTTTPRPIVRVKLADLSTAEKALDNAKQSASNNVVASQIEVAELRLAVIDPKSAVAIAVNDAERTVEKLKASGAIAGKIAEAEQKVVALKIGIAESKSISVENIVEAQQNLDAVLKNPKASAVEIANATATYTEARTPSFVEASAIVNSVVDDFTMPVIVPGVVDAAGSGNFVMFDGAVQQTLELKRVNESVMVLSSSDGFKISIAAVDKDGNVFEFNSRGAVVVKHGNFISVAGEGFAPNSTAKTWLFSSPRELGAVNVDAQGRFAAEFRIDEDVRIGDHVSQVNGLSPSGEKRSVNIDVEILPNVGPAPFDPLGQPGNVLTLVAELVTLLAVAGAGRRREDDDEERESAEVAEVAVSHRGAVIDRDRDRLRVLAVGVIDRLSVGAPRGVVGLSPMLARVFGDGVYLRSITGVLWLVLPFVGAGFGFGAASSSGFDAVMPSLFWLSALVVLGVFDAFSGFVGALAFGLAVGFGGGVVSADSVRGLLGVWVFCFAAPLIAGAVRPFRRVRSDSDNIVWDRCVDFVLIVLFGAWVAGSMYSALPGLTGFNSLSAGYVNHVRVVVLVALAIRFVLENFAVAVTPVRLKALTREPLPEPTLLQQICSAIVRTGVYMFVAVVFIGNNWALWLGGVLYLVPKLVSLGADKLPDMKPVHRYLPRGIFKVVLMLFVAKWWGSIVIAQVNDPADMIKFGFVLLGIPGLALGAVGWFARSSRPWSSTIVSKVIGTALLVVGVLVVLNIWKVL